MNKNLNLDFKKISKLNPLEDSHFTYDKNKWSKLSKVHQKNLKIFENKLISRKDVVRSYKDYFKGKDTDATIPFLITMVWGYANSGYAEFRVNKIIELKENIEFFKNAMDLLKKNKNADLENSFKELDKIKGLGISFISKILYFAQRALNDKNYALIFDIKVAKSLVAIYLPNNVRNMVSISPSSKFSSYKQYIDLLHSISIKHKCDADKLEMFLFVNAVNY